MGVYYIGTKTDGTYTAATGNSIYIVGELLAADGTGFDFGRVNDNVLVANGDIYGGIYGVIGNGPSHLTVQVGDDSTIRGYYGAITLYGNAHTVINKGMVATDAYVGVGVHFYNYAASPAEGTLRNDGDIFSYDRGVLAEGVRLLLDNSGSIVGAHGAGIATATGGARIVNSGEITGDTVGVAVAGGAGETDWITNSGTITGASGVALTSDDAVLRLDNTGTLFGDVDAGGGGDRIVNGGTIFGAVALGTGDDLYVARASGDALSVAGDAGADTLRGSRGDDALDGGADADRLAGGAGDDSLFGGSGDDVVISGAGDDTLVGGTGADTLTGGRGADVFVYATGDGADVITDLHRRAETLDLTGTGLDEAAILAAAAQDGSSVLIDLGVGDTLTLQRFSLANLADVLLLGA